MNWQRLIPNERLKTNAEYILVLMSRSGPSGRIQSCRLREGKPFVIGSIFAWDCGDDRPTHWAEYPDLPEDVK